jgi:hypothetical protein
VECESQTDIGNNCVVVSGELTVYTDDSDVGSVKDMIQESIKDNMDAGNFDQAQSDIVRVQFVNLENISNGGTSGASTPTDSNIGSGSAVRVGLFVAAGLLVAVVGGLAYKRRAKSMLEDDTQIGGGNSQVS